MSGIQGLFKQPWVSLPSLRCVIWYIIPLQVCSAAVHLAFNYLSNRSNYSLKRAARDFSVGLLDPFCCIKIASITRNLFRTVDKTNASSTTHSNLDISPPRRDYKQLSKFLSETATGGRQASQAVTAALTLNAACQVVMETRNSIINSVNTFIASSKNLLSKEVIFLLGQTGSGKSTALCYLRGDPMEITIGGYYNSTTDSKRVISHAPAQSGTFFPNLEVINGQIVVDFPGFDDTHGALACLGMELALKTLLNQHPSKILALYPIGADEDRFSWAHNLGRQLNRLVQNPRDCCVLGTTKYSRYIPYSRILDIEKEQKKTNSQNLPLPETEQKKRNREMICEQEGLMLKHVNLQHLTRFDNLLDSEKRIDCLDQLSKRSTAVVQPAYELMPEHKRSLSTIFESYLKNKHCFEKPSTVTFTGYEQLKASVLKHGLLATIAPDMEEFFKLPEIHQAIGKTFDLELIRYFMTAYMKGINCLEFYRMESALKPFVDQPEVQLLSKKLKALRELHESSPTKSYKFDEGLGHLILPWWATVELSAEPSAVVETIKILDQLVNLTSQTYDQETQRIVKACNQEIEKMLQQWKHLAQIKNLVLPII